MQDPNALKPGRIRELTKALLDRVNERVAGITEIWYTLAQVNWDPDRLSKLHRHIKDLAADSGKFGLVPLTDSLSSLDICLAPYLGSDLRPSPQQIDKVFALIRALKSAAEITVRAETRAVAAESVQKALKDAEKAPSETQKAQGVDPDDNAPEQQTRVIERGHFVEYLEGLVSSEKLGFGGVLVVELDELEKVGKRMAGGVADAMLSEATNLIAAQMNSEDLASRISANACAVIASRPTSEGLLALAEQLRRAIEIHLFRPREEPLTATASIGLCEFEEYLNESDDLIARASSACAEARAAGGNRIEIHNRAKRLPASNDNADGMLRLLRDTLEQGGFHVLFRPLINLRNGVRELYELAPLLPTPGGDRIPRSDFLIPARDANLLTQVDHWIIEQALVLMDKHRHEGGESNLLVEQGAAALKDPARVEWIREQLRARQLVGTGLSLEFDLADLAADLNATKKYFETLGRMGISLSLTGFNADAAAFETLKQLPVEYVELDERFTTMGPDIMASVVDKVHALGIKVVAASNECQKNTAFPGASGIDFPPQPEAT